MVSKSRLGGFVDGIVAVVMTIMLLEFRIPESGLLMDFLRNNLVYMIAYILSFIYVTTSWFNQQYMLTNAERVTRRIYVSTMLWILSLSLLPVLAAWTGRTIDLFDHLGSTAPKTPALLFMAMIGLWGLAYVQMSKAYILDNPPHVAEKIKAMEVLHVLNHPIWILVIFLAMVATYFYPPFVLIYTAGEMIWSMLHSKNEQR